jgi:hypothetical protein
MTDQALSRVPHPSAAAAILAAVAPEAVQACRDRERSAALLDLCGRQGVDIRQVLWRTIGDSHLAVLVPGGNGRFRVTLNSPEAYRSIRRCLTYSAFARRLVAHEVAHTFFYDRTTFEPKRAIPVSLDEERFCDAFADAFMAGAGLVNDRAGSGETRAANETAWS